MKRFWKLAQVVSGDGWTVALDGRPLRTPARVELVLSNEALAEAIAAEWSMAAADFDPRDMPLTGLANAAIDRVALDVQGFAASLARYAESDLLCYRAEAPVGLVKREADAWDPLLEWARLRFDVELKVTLGVAPIAQPEGTVARFRAATATLDAWRLAPLSPIVTIGGSLIVGLAIVERVIDVEAGWAAVSVDEQWQMERWGADAEAVAALDSRKRDFMVAGRFLDLVAPAA